MSKVGILTFHRAINYGALMQGYALQEALREVGQDAYMVDFRAKYIENAYRLLWGLQKNSWTSWKRTIRNIPGVRSKKKKFRDFANRYLRLTKSCKSGNIKDVTADFDALITGSDQVWNMDVCGNERAYMLDFLDDSRRKCSYAVSIGGYKFNDEELALLNGFGKLSMREPSSSAYLAGETGREVNTNVDPTLLLGGEKWKTLVEPNQEKQEYIFLYSVHPQNHLVEEAKKLAAKENLKIIHLHNRVKSELKESEEGVEVVFNLSPTEFLSYINHAKYVLTNSFHGTVFSIIFHKQFKSELETKGGFNNRVWDLLQSLGLERRVLEPIAYYNEGATIQESVNWDDVETKLANLRKGSVEYIKNIV